MKTPSFNSDYCLTLYQIAHSQKIHDECNTRNGEIKSKFSTHFLITYSLQRVPPLIEKLPVLKKVEKGYYKMQADDNLCAV